MIAGIVGIIGIAEQNMAGADEDLARDQVGHKGTGVIPEVATATHEVVLMTAETRALGIEIVLQQVNAAGHPPLFQASIGLLGEIGHGDLSSPVLSQEIGQLIALRGGELGVTAHVEVQARPATGEDIGGPAEAHDGLEQFTCGMVSVQRRYAASC